jgi:hypothetical protein
MADPDKRPAAVHYAAPSLSKLVEWLDRKQEEVDNRFYRSQQQPTEIYDADQLRRIMAKHVRTGRAV